MAKQIMVIFSVFIFSMAAFPQAPRAGNVKGTVHMADGTKLPGVAVSIVGTNISSITDKEGTYFLTGIIQGVVMVVASLDGFEEVKRAVVVQSGITIVVDFTLEMTNISHEAFVTANMPLLTASDKISMITLTPRQIQILPSLGEKDIFRAFQLLPGISGSNETSSGLYIRGGTPDQNLVTYDGFTIYHVDHLFGYFSTFNPEAVDYAQLSKGGYESKYGGRLSSVLELKGKSGDEKKFHIGGGVSLLSFNGLVEVPLFGKGSVLIAGRRSFQSPLYENILDMFTENLGTPMARARPGGGMGGGGPFGAMFDTQPRSYFYDLNAKATLNPTSKDNFSLSFYNGKDNLDNSREMQLPSFFVERLAERGIEIEFEGGITDLTNWGNTGSSANWSRQWNKSFTSQFVIAYSNYFNTRDRTNRTSITRINPEAPEDAPEPRSFERGSVEDNDLQDITFRLDNIINIRSNNQLELGFQITSNDIKYAYDVDDAGEEGGANQGPGFRRLIGILDREDQGTQYSAYLQDKWTLFNKLTITPGIRATYFDQTEDYYYEPRLSFIFNLINRVKLKGAWGKYHQIVNRITREDIMQGNREFWVLSDEENIPVGEATHYITGISYETEGFLFDIEAYYKDLSGLSEFALRFTPSEENIDYNRYFYEGTGIAKGIEFLIQKKSGKYTGWMSYTLGNVEHDFPDLSENPFPALHDQTHEFKLVNIYEFKNLTFTGTWIFATGKPYTEPIGIEEETIGERFTISRVIVGEKNGARLPDYHRLDLSVTYDFKFGESKATLGLTIFNVYDRKNVWYKEFDVIEGEIVETNVQLMGLTFNLFFNIKF